ncbi:MAG TPA: SDR family oxidoreductase [Candidatus Acidoferrum sp.]|nr:SDR family oxidoreductase [Candidatus Acidoferrum sp.]
MSSTTEVVLVTGASSGFGRLISETLARRGFAVFATMRDVKGRNAAASRELQDLGKRESLRLHVLELDVTDDTSVVRAVSEVLAKYGRIDVLVNNAGYGVMDLAETVSLAQAQRQFDTNFFGIMRMNRAVLPGMKRQGSGLLLHVSSGAGRLAIPGMAIYCASKFAMEALAEVYRYELASLGIESVVIEPGAYATPIMGKLEIGEDPARKSGYGEMTEVPEKLKAKIGASRANPQEIADKVLQIIDTPAGQRQMRYRVGPGSPGVERINTVTDEIQAQMLEAFGIAALTKLKVPSGRAE